MTTTRFSLRREVVWRLEAAGFDLLSIIVRALPIEAVSAAGGRLFRWLGPLSSAHRTAEQSLRLAFPQMADAERAALLAAQWENFGRYVAEFPLVDRLIGAAGRVEVVGQARLEAIAAAGRPVVFVSGHFANLEVMPAAIIAAGVPCQMTYRAANNPYVDARIRRSRERYGVRLFAPKGRDGARELLATLERGCSVAMLVDQRYDAGVPAPFFGKPIPTLPAAVRLALRFGTVLQPMSVQRLEGARFLCLVHEPIVLQVTSDRAADIAAGVAQINAFIEARIRERPGEWWWLHRRWPREAYDQE